MTVSFFFIGMAQCGYRAWQSRVVQPATVRQEGPVVERDVGITSQTIQIVRLVLTPERPTTYTGAATAKDGDPLLAGHEGSRKHGTQEGGVVQSNPKSASIHRNGLAPRKCGVT